MALWRLYTSMHKLLNWLFKKHTLTVSEFYRGKRDVFERLMKKHLDGLAQWDTPEAGMFFWCAHRLTGPCTDNRWPSGIFQVQAVAERLSRVLMLALPQIAFSPNPDCPAVQSARPHLKKNSPPGQIWDWSPSAKQFQMLVCVGHFERNCLALCTLH